VLCGKAKSALTGREVLGIDDAAGEVERKKYSISLLSVLIDCWIFDHFDERFDRC
jgi:hypothetical protein